MTKYVFVTGGVLSGLGKGTIAASIGFLVKSCGLNVTILKIDPYLNVDAGSMSPYVHGEVFVTEDGGETDMDIGHYERFLGTDLSKKNSITSGKIYYSVIMKERRGDYQGQCVQVIPHVTNEVKERIREIARETNADIAIVEIGGTVGDIEGLPYQEAARQMRFEEGDSNTFYVHLGLAPILSSGELKTKPIQHSVQELRRIGIQPDAIIARSLIHLDSEARQKIALYSNIPPRAVFSCPYTDSPYEVPIILKEQGFTKYLFEKLMLNYKEPEISAWIDFVNKLKENNHSKQVKIAMIGKYTKIKESYISIIEAITHASAWSNVKPHLEWIESSDIEDNPSLINELESAHGALILPGFCKRGAEGTIMAIKRLRELGRPILGVSFGMQLMVIEAARNLAGLANANSAEIDPNTPDPVVDLPREQAGLNVVGGAFRLGAKKILLEPGTLAWKIYGSCEIYERHRHRYVVNPKYASILETSGLKISGYSEEGYPEIVELRGCDVFYLGIQAHPEFRSKPLLPSPLYLSFIKQVASVEV
ncbi:MAG: CTP synthase [Desulfurococcaceae archaeon]